jgi:hypothetical protein
LEGHQNGINSLAFFADGKTLASGGYNGEIRLWEVATGKQRTALPGHDGMVGALLFSADGKFLISGSNDTTALIWDLTSRASNGSGMTGIVANDLKDLWRQLAGDDAALAYQAIGAMIAAPSQAVPFLKDHLQPVPPCDSRQLQQWIANLDDNRYATRKNAVEELEKLGELAEPALRRVLTGKPSAEVRRRAANLLDQMDAVALKPESIRTLRAMEVLERIGTPEAKQVLEGLARGAPGAKVTQEAEAALKRLGKRALARTPSAVPWHHF